MNSNEILSMDRLMFAMQQRNLVYNYNFLNYSNQTVDNLVTYGHPDGWVYRDAGLDGMIGFESGTNSCMIRKSTGTGLMSFSQALHEFPRWEDVIPGKELTACAVILSPGSTSAEVTFSINDGIDISSKTVSFNPGEEKKISMSLNVNQQAKKLVIAIESRSTDVILNIRKVYANIGGVALEQLPCIIEGNIGERKQYVSTSVSPATELSVCKESMELPTGYSRLNSFLNGKFGLGTAGNSMLPDMRGYFSRAWNNGATIDPDASSRTALGQGKITGDQVSTVEQDELKAHTHPLQFDLSGQIPAGPSASLPSINKGFTSETNSKGGAETRAKNIAELYTIKWA